MAAQGPWMKFYPADWRGDQALRICSLAARGLWMEMLCVMHEAIPRGSFVINGQPVSDKQLAALAGCSGRELSTLVLELEGAGVFSREVNGTMYSRRMRRDQERAERDKVNGRSGGNPTLKRGVNPSVNGGDKAQKPEARDQKPESAADAREPWLNLAAGLVKAFEEANNPNLPDTRRSEMWLAQGYDADLCLAVVREGLSRKRDRTISNLAYFDNAIKEAHEKRAPTPVPDKPIDWDHWAQFYRDHSSWPASLGPEPGYAGCRCPPEILARYKLKAA